MALAVDAGVGSEVATERPGCRLTALVIWVAAMAPHAQLAGACWMDFVD